MPVTPNTNESLIVRLQSNDHEAAWEEFVATYRPAIMRTAISMGLQPTDAEDLAQQVLLSVSKSIKDWEADPRRGRFRTWLGRIIRNGTINAITRRQHDRGIGGTKAMKHLNEQAMQNDSLQELRFQWQQEAFRWAADQIRGDFHDDTWRAFWLTAVEGKSAASAAEEIGKSVGAIYVAKTRVMQKLQETVRNIDSDFIGEQS